jgi:hypothetical protein
LHYYPMAKAAKRHLEFFCAWFDVKLNLTLASVNVRALVALRQ